MKKIILSLCLIFYSSLTFSQQTQDVEMADQMRSSGKIYVVITVLAVIFAGIVAYLVNIDRKLSKLEKEMDSRK